MEWATIIRRRAKGDHSDDAVMMLTVLLKTALMRCPREKGVAVRIINAHTHRYAQLPQQHTHSHTHLNAQWMLRNWASVS